MPDRLDELLLNPSRLAIVALLAATKWAEFASVRDGAGLTDSALSKQMNVLCDNGYIEIRKGYVGSRPRTWLNITPAGRATLSGHIEALQTIARNASGA